MLTHLTNLFRLLLLLSVTGASAHPGEDRAAEAVERAASLAAMGKRSISHCAGKLAARGVHARNAARRAALHSSLKRDLSAVLNTTHRSNVTGITPDTNSSVIFEGEHQCMLGPEATQGPYYVTGEYFRSNVTESEVGIPIYVDIQVIDTQTCEPLPNVALDFWHCNATGTYSGVVTPDNGGADPSILNATFLRGIQATDEDGVAQFQSIFPGHYTGRTNHIHILAKTEGMWSLLPNNTITGDNNTAHVGQLYFDQSLIEQVEKVPPYSSNTQNLTLNKDDWLLAGEAAVIDPVLEYVLLGNTIEDGLFTWISMGLNASASYSVSVAAHIGEDGAVAYPNPFFEGCGGNSSNTTMPGPGEPMVAPNCTTGPSTVGNNTAILNETSEAAVNETSGANSIFSMSFPLAAMAAALPLAHL